MNCSIILEEKLAALPPRSQLTVRRYRSAPRLSCRMGRKAAAVRNLSSREWSQWSLMVSLSASSVVQLVRLSEVSRVESWPGIWLRNVNDDEEKEKIRRFPAGTWSRLYPLSSTRHPRVPRSRFSLSERNIIFDRRARILTDSLRIILSSDCMHVHVSPHPPPSGVAYYYRSSRRRPEIHRRHLRLTWLFSLPLLLELYSSISAKNFA